MKKRIAAIGPRYRDPKFGHTSRFIRFKWFHNARVRNEAGRQLVRTDFLISSGSFYRIGVFEKIGLFNEALFIDHVDTEWCLRAKSLGYECYGVWNAVMRHSLGEKGLRIWLSRWRVQPLHRPFRLYFIVRNSLLLYRMPHASWKWVSGDVARLMRLCVVYLLAFPPRHLYIKYLFKGLVDGFKGVSGKQAIVP